MNRSLLLLFWKAIGPFIAALLLSSCVPDASLAILDNAINTLDNMPSKWDATMKDVIDKLDKVDTQTAKNVLADVESTSRKMEGDIQSLGFCSADFVGIRLSQQLQEIRHSFFPNDRPAPVKVPVICNTEPQVVEPGDTTIIEYYGFDLNDYEAQKFVADLEDESGKVTIPSIGTVSVTSNYLLQVNIQCLGESDPDCAKFLNLDPTSRYQLVLKWDSAAALGGGTGGKSQLPVEFPTPTPVPPPTPVPSSRFSIRVTTGDVKNGGTDANVFITLIGDLSTSKEIKLDTGDHNDFDRGGTDTYSIYTESNIGVIRRIRIRHDNSDDCKFYASCEKPGWFLDSIVVTNLDTQQETRFVVGRWLATSEPQDGGIDQYLTPSN